MTITWSLATIIVDDKIDNDEQMHLLRRPFRWPRQCAGAIQTASPNAACPGLLPKPLDAGIGRLLAPYCPSVGQGNNKQNNNQTIHPLCWPRFDGHCDAAVRYRAHPPMDGVMASLEATGCHHWASTCSNSHQLDMPTPVFLVFFIVKLSKRPQNHKDSP